MLMGHYAPAVWDTQRGKTVPLITLWQAFLAVQAIDIVFAILAIAGIEGTVMKDGQPFFDIPWSHSLLSSLIIASIVAALFRILKPSAGFKGSVVIGLLVFSHWVLDYIVHRPDLPIYPGGNTFYGLGFWNYPIAAFVLEIGLLFLALFYWVRVTEAKASIYKIAPWIMFVIMAVMQFVFITYQGIKLAYGEFDETSQISNVTLGVSALLTYAGLTSFIAWIEKGRPSKFV
jgi:hypothetical protein